MGPVSQTSGAAAPLHSPALTTSDTHVKIIHADVADTGYMCEG